MTQVAQHDLGRVIVVEQNAFGDFDFDLRGRGAGFFQQALQLGDEIRIAQLGGRDVDGDFQAGPAAGVLHGAAHDEGAEVVHQAALFGERDEIAWRHRTARRMRPAAQSFDTDDVTEMIDLRLVDDVERFDVDGFAQAGFERLAQLDGSVHFDFEEGVLTAAGILGAIKGQVGLAQGFGRFYFAIAKQGYADRAG